MKTKTLNKIIDTLAKKHSIIDYKINKIILTDFNFAINTEGKLVNDQLINVEIIPLNYYLKGLPITFSIENKN
jgi:hypothetical protein